MNRFEKILLTIFFVELFVGGGGRLIDFGVLSIRQVLFLLLFLTFIVRIVKEKAVFDKNINTFIRVNPVTIGIYALLIWFVVSAAIGFVNGHPLSIIVMDFFRVSFFVVYFPLAYYISNERFTLNRIITLLKYSAFVVALFTIIVALLGKTVFVDNFNPFYRFMNTIMNDDLYFRPSNSVFYKSHFFVLIGLILSLNDILNKNFRKFDVMLTIFASVSIIWSETRGFLLAFMLSLLMIIIIDIKVIVDPIKGLQSKMKKLLQSQKFIKKFAITILVLAAVPFLYKNMTLERFEVPSTEEHQVSKHDKGHVSPKEKQPEVNDVSVNARMEFLVASKEILVHPMNLIFGLGYGSEVAGRTDGLEMSFLDILLEQGLIGLAIWCFLFLMVYVNYYLSFRQGKKITTLDISLMAVFMGILLLTNINPFINNPIGISFFLVLLIVSQQKRELRLNGEFK
ncbi:O-antigen ligase family protein [Neobacillus sp. WH10]|uniref:O-antigen ligase family protein n=1 Tax=Neobacillus sp. WH10 TaxID=3047873 RepID=UPI0024C0F5CA|nr:O-antigen ligase family protein [Neobacillus sp. WH10]WHY76921.1 O-antigen ligase family protein [Neobacillus sp. WH10]